MRQAAESAARIGYTGLEIFGVPKHLPPTTTDAEAADLRRLLDGLGLETVTICSYAGGFAELGDRECQAQVDVFRRYLEIAALLGCTMVRVWPDKLGQNITTPREDHWLRAAHYVGLCADHALAQGASVLIENHLAMTISVDMTHKLLRAVDRPNVVVNFDPGNMYLAGQEYGRAAVRRLRSHIGNVQVKEGGGGTYDLLLGEGEMDHQSYLRALAEGDYDGFYMAECHKTPTAEWPPERIAEHELAALRALLDRAGAKCLAN